MIDRDLYWNQKIQLSNIQSQLEDAQRHVTELEKQNQLYKNIKNENEIIKLKLTNTEERLTYYEQGIKRRVLQDTTNIIKNNNNHTSSTSNNENLYEKKSAKNAIRGLVGSKTTTSTTTISTGSSSIQNNL